jgi:RNA polymerase sigma-70 factor, ECF subfamily
MCAAASSEAPAEELRLARCVRDHLPAVWRMLRRHGVPEADADDAAQKVFLVLSRRLTTVATDHELPFLLRTAVFVASEMRRELRRRREVDEPEPENHASQALRPDAALEQCQALRALDEVLAEMDEPLRTVFVLFELEEMTMAAIAQTLEVPPGTVASRLRRAREQFDQFCRRGGAR